ncbi:hypothetical protein QP400_06460 [Winkia sp. UMB3158]|jgi:hypothetical protein|uniref:Uncharacterized protein n=3 Tax=Bacillati TaxID=1783272 RepID=A0AB38XPU2_9ACTO|nr:MULTISPECIES: hypothetical protein [Winkia]MDK8340967.1 hypothetical protein [Winkia sp. UMB3164B]OFK03356.1 hypothetical protein HMPREF2835_04970 [Actinomyces sp. HMSC072A03]OFT54406.1 hypothetical protein HMPREF3152_07955 [Actinomyces sp. HMSC06A08]KWZ75470.1 hypothetical protein HMPREF3198_00081 [Winkia neuii]MDK6241377.1 hypothetical protein [Winkia sp. UMB10116]
MNNEEKAPMSELELAKAWGAVHENLQAAVKALDHYLAEEEATPSTREPRRRLAYANVDALTAINFLAQLVPTICEHLRRAAAIKHQNH